MLASHYAPKLPLRLNATTVAPDEALLAFGPPLPAPVTFQLSERQDLFEAASRLFEGLHWLDANAANLRGIAVMPIPTHSLGLAINDRLTRASTPRS
jgi:L-threonylcarbamoyladenylate synthase